MDELKVAFADLKASIEKQWGAVPTEIQTELNVISLLLNRPEPPAAEPVE